MSLHSQYSLGLEYTEKGENSQGYLNYQRYLPSAVESVLNLAEKYGELIAIDSKVYYSLKTANSKL